MDPFTLWTRLFLISFASWSSATEMTSSTWRCVGNTADPNLTLSECACVSVLSSGYTWTNVDCTRRNFTKFATNTTLPLFIKRLDLSRNNITVLSESPFQHWNPLKELILSYNGLVSIIENPFSGLELLSILDLSHNKLTVLPSNLIFENKRVTMVNLNFNNIASLPPDIFDGNWNLTSLSLSYNNGIANYINHTPSALFRAFRNGLSRLELNHANLSRFPANFFNEAFNLSELYIADNPFKTVPNLFIGGLEVLDLSGADIDVLESGKFVSLPLLKDLYLNRMVNVTEVQEGAFGGLKNLRSLFMENCVQLQSFHGLVFGPTGTELKHLRNFSLAQGGLQILSPELRLVLEQVDSVELHGNPWHCDCNLSWILQLNLTSHERKKLRCFSPPHARGARLFSLTSDMFPCPRPVSRVRSGLFVGIAIMLAMLCLAVVILALDFLRRYRKRFERPTRVGRYQTIEVQLEANRAEMEWEDRDTAGQSGVSS